MPDVDAYFKLWEDLRKKHGHFSAHMAFADLACLIGQVQLALRHPANTGYSAVRARELVTQLIDELDAAAPGLGEYLRLGFDPAHDGPVHERGR